MGERGTRGWYGLLGNRDVGTVAVAVGVVVVSGIISFTSMRNIIDGEGDGPILLRDIRITHFACSRIIGCTRI